MICSEIVLFENKFEVIFLFILSILRNHNKYMINMEEQKFKGNNFHHQSSPAETIPSFLLKTYQILENDKFNDIISWTRNGEGFIVKKVKEFADNILPVYFRHSNYTSFVRQLNMYDFHKTRQQNHQNAFKNAIFKRGHKHHLKDIQRKDYKKNKENNKQAINPEKSVIQKSKQIHKIQRQNEKINQINPTNLSKIYQLNIQIQKKALSLAQIKEIAQQNINILKLLDVLFDAKKLQREMIQKLEIMQKTYQNNRYISYEKYEIQQLDSIKKIQLPTADKLILPITSHELKDDKIKSFSTLFSSFRQA